MLSTPGRAETRSRYRSGHRFRHRLREGAAPATAVIALALALGVSACAGPDATPSGAGTAKAAGAASAGRSYADSAAVIDALKRSGQACSPVSGSSSTSVSAPGLRSVSVCSLGSAEGGTITASVFDDHADAEVYADLLTSAQGAGLLLGDGASAGTGAAGPARAVLGPNWVVLVDGAAAANRLGSALGGSVVGGSAQSG